MKIFVFSALCIAASLFLNDFCTFAADRTRSALQPVPTVALTYANVVSYFKETHLRATEVQKRCTIFFEGEWKTTSAYDYCVVMVENDDEDVQITFYLTDAHEMNWITEFVDSRFFTNAEKQTLFDRVTRGRNTRNETIGRFKVDVSHSVPRHAEIVVLSFTPLQRRNS